MQPAKQASQPRVEATPGGPGSTPLPLGEQPVRPPARARRFMKAYWVTFVVVASYLWIRLFSRFRSPATIERLLEAAHQRNARRIEKAILELQGLFIKVGQLISIMTNFLPAAFRRELEGLQDQVPPRPFRDIEARIREEFGGRGPGELFAEFAERPIAAASIGQVHVARLFDGRVVAVKVQYPDIEEIVRSDLATLQRIFRIVGRFVPYQGLDGVYREVRSMVLAELDFRAEADNVKRIAAHFEGRTDVCLPKVVDELTTARVLTTQWEDGTKIGDIDALKASGVDVKALARLVVEAYCQQIFVDGIYHADPHPGNLLVRKGPDGAPCVVFLDFGAVAEISPRMRQGIIEFLQGAIHHDTPRIVKAMREMGFIARGADDRIFDRVVEYFHQRFQEEIQLDSLSLGDLRIDPKKGLENLADLRRMNISFRDLSASFHVPKEWILLERTILLLTGLCTALDPEMNPMAVIRPYLERFVLGPDQDWSKFVVEATRELASSAVALPGEMRRFMARARAGELELTFRNVDDAARLMYTLGHQAIYAAIGIAAAGIAVALGGQGEEANAQIAWIVSAGAGAWLALSMLANRNRLRRRKR